MAYTLGKRFQLRCFQYLHMRYVAIEMNLRASGALFNAIVLTPKRLLFWTCIEDRNGSFRPGNILMQFSQRKT